MNRNKEAHRYAFGVYHTVCNPAAHQSPYTREPQMIPHRCNVRKSGLCLQTQAGFALLEIIYGSVSGFVYSRKTESRLKQYPTMIIPRVQIAANRVRSFGLIALPSITMEGRERVVTAIMKLRTTPS